MQIKDRLIQQQGAGTGNGMSTVCMNASRRLTIDRGVHLSQCPYCET